MGKSKLILLIVTIMMATIALSACGSVTRDEQGDNSTQDGSQKATNEENSGELNLYTGRHYDTDQMLYDQFFEETGIEVNVIEGKDDELIARLEREGKASQADLLITADAGRLHRAKEAGLLQKVNSDVLEENIPEKLRDEDNQWFGLTKRARIIAYNKETVNPEQIQSYQDLTNEEWKGKVLIRSSSNIYNQSLVASIIALEGEEAAKVWAQGIVDNMAREPKGGDRDQAKAMIAGEGDLAVMNSYYLGHMLNSDDPEEVKVAEQIGVIFPNQETTGTHINISGIGMTASSKNEENALKFMEFLTEKSAQELFAEANYEYPVNPNVSPSELLQSWGEFKEQDLNLTELGEHNDAAIKIMNEVGWK